MRRQNAGTDWRSKTWLRLTYCSPFIYIVGFLSQQAAEKALKSCLLAIGVTPPRIHGLRQLRDQVPASKRPLVADDDLDLLDPWVIDGRYAADLPDVDVEEARSLVVAARRVVDAIGQITSTG